MQNTVAKLFHDLDCGLTPLNVFVEYLPLPLFINRDRANRELTELFLDIIKKRNAKAAADLAAGLVPEKKYDVLETLMTSVYKAGEKMGDIAVAHMMIALLMAGLSSRPPHQPPIINTQVNTPAAPRLHGCSLNSRETLTSSNVFAKSSPRYGRLLTSLTRHRASTLPLRWRV